MANERTAHIPFDLLSSAVVFGLFFFLNHLPVRRFAPLTLDEDKIDVDVGVVSMRARDALRLAPLGTPAACGRAEFFSSTAK